MSQVDGRADRLRKKLVRDLDAFDAEIKQDKISLDVLDMEHFMGTGPKFKKDMVKKQELVKSLRAKVVVIFGRIDRTARPAFFLPSARALRI